MHFKHYGHRQHVQKLQKTSTDQGVIWLSIVSSAAQAEDIRKTPHSNATAVLLDPKGKVGTLYQVKTTPQMVVINKVGNLIYMGAIDDRPTVDPADVPGAMVHYVTRVLDQAMNGKTAHAIRPLSFDYGCSVKYN